MSKKFEMIQLLLFMICIQRACTGLANVPDAPPTNINLQVTGPSSIQVSWSPPPAAFRNGDIRSYKIIHFGSPFDTGMITLNIPASADQEASYMQDINFLEEFNMYDFQLAAVNAEGVGVYSASMTVQTDSDTPGMSPNLVVFDVRETSITITLDAPPGTSQNGLITSYAFTITGDPFPFMEMPPVEAANGSYPDTQSYMIVFTGLEEFNTYNISVVAVNVAGSSPPSALLSITTLEAVPSSIDDLMATVLNSTSIQVVITPPSPSFQNGLIISYTIEYIGSAVDTLQNEVTIPITDQTYPAANMAIYHILTGLEEFENYTIMVFPVTSAGTATGSPVVFAETYSSVPDMPPVIFSIVTAQTSLTIVWDPPTATSQNGEIISYSFIITGNPFLFTDPAPSYAASGSYPDTQQYTRMVSGLEEFNSYNISIAAVNDAGTGPFSTPQIVLTLQAAPTGAPQNLSIDSVAPTTLNISFLQPIGQLQNGPLTRYDVLYQGITFTTASELFQIFYLVEMIPMLTSSEVLLTLQGLDEFNGYNIRVRAINSVGFGPRSGLIIGTTSEAAPNMSPSPISITVLNATSINVMWQPPPGISQNGVITSYTFNITGSPLAFTGIPPVELASGSYPDTQSYSTDITGLEEFNTYNISIIAVNAAGSSPPSTFLNESTPETVPGRPRLIGALALNATSIRVVWRAPIPTDQNGIIIEYNITFIPITTSNIYPETKIILTDGILYPIPSSVLYEEEVTGLEEGITYDIYVRASNIIGEGLPSLSVIRETTPAIAPPNVPPFNISAVNITSVSSNSIGLSLPNVSSVFLGGEHTGFTFIYQGFITFESLFSDIKRSADSIYITDFITIVTENENDFLITGLFPNFNYLINISANNAAGTSGALQLYLITLDSDVPSSPPINLQAIATSYSTIAYTWDNNLTTINGYLSGYRLYYSEAGEDAISMLFEVDALGPYTFVLSDLAANTLYSFSIAVVNELGEGPNSTLVWTTTYPTVPNSTIQSFPTTDSPATESQGIVQIQVPSQNSFPTADIAVIYIISDMTEPPLFTTLSVTVAYSHINAAIDGVLQLDTESNIRIQAVLDVEYFNKDGLYFLFTIGDNNDTSYNGNSYINMPLQPETSYELSYYILFYDENGDISPEFSLIGSSITLVTVPAPSTRFCVECVVIPIVVVLLLILLLIILILLFLCYWYKQRKAVHDTVHSRNSPIRQVQLQKMEKSIAEKDGKMLYTDVHASSKEDVVAGSIEKKGLP